VDRAILANPHKFKGISYSVEKCLDSALLYDQNEPVLAKAQDNSKPLSSSSLTTVNEPGLVTTNQLSKIPINEGRSLIVSCSMFDLNLFSSIFEFSQ